MHRFPQLVNGDIDTLRTMTDRELDVWIAAMSKANDALERVTMERENGALILREIQASGMYISGERVDSLDEDVRYTFAEYFREPMDHSVYIYGQNPLNYAPDGPRSSFTVVDVSQEPLYVTIHWIPERGVYRDSQKRHFDSWAKYCAYWPSPIVTVHDTQ